MTIPSSGPVTFTDIQTEFGGTNPIALNEYYAGGGLVPAGTTGTYGAVPSSGQISVQNFYGTTAYTPIYVEEVFNSWLYKGNGSTQTITNGIDLSTKGGMVWTKSRSNATDHLIFDTARTGSFALFPNLTNAQSGTGSPAPTFTTTGYTVNSSQTMGANNFTYVGWTFREQPKFFDIVTYTGNGVSGRSVSHNLGSTPGCIMIKRTSGASDWVVYHRSIGSSATLILNGNFASADYGNNISSVTSSSFNVTAGTDSNANGSTYVAYIYAHNAGGFGPTGSDNVITCGSFTAVNINGNSSGLVTDLGYEPQLVLYKKYSAGTENWFLVDVNRGFSQRENNALFPNNTSTESNTAGGNSQFPSPTGFQLNLSGAVGSTYVYIAIRRGPMKVPTVGTSVFMPLVTTASDTAVITTGFPVDLQIGGYYTANNTDNNWNAFTRRIQLSTVTDNSGAGLRTSSTLSENTGLTFPYNYNNTGYQNYGSRTWSLNFSRAPQFFEVVCYSGNDTAMTINHNLGVSPELIIVKKRNDGQNWSVNRSSDLSKNISLNTVTVQNSYTTYSSLTSTTVNFNSGGSGLTTSGSTYVMYLFATCAGVSKVGTYTGTGTTQTINCGFTTGARFVMTRCVTDAGQWFVFDTARGMVAGTDPVIYLNSTGAQNSGNSLYTVSSGFQVLAAPAYDVNNAGQTYLFLAIA